MQTRVEGWLDPFADDDFGQIVEGLYGMAWGGLVGRGLGQGEPWRIPFSYSDYIVAAVGEELGLTGLMAMILLFGLIVERALRTALICRDGFGKLMATGFGIVFALQVFVVIGGVTKLIPLTGLTTPFMSYGGSSMVANWVVIGLLLRISDHARRPLPDFRPTFEDDATQVVQDEPMNKPIRTMAVFCMVLFVALLLNASYLQYLRADDLNDRNDNRRVRDAEFSRKRGAILVAGHPGRREHAGRRPVRVPARLPPAVQVRPRDRLLLLHLRRQRGRVEPERHPLRQRPAAVRRPRRRHGQQHPAARAGRSR